MKILLVTLRKRAGSDDVSRRETILEGERIRLGRGVAMEINLPDIEVDFHHADLVGGPTGLSLVAAGENGIRVGRKAEQRVELSQGAEARIGRYRFRAEPGRDGAEHVLILEEEPATASRRSTRRVKRRVPEVLPSRRLIGWVLSLSILGVFFLWPMADVLTREAPSDDAVVVDGMARTDVPDPSLMELSWLSGPLSESHAMIEDDCGACHMRPFERTTNNACLACHALVENHADPAEHPSVSLEAHRCASCHKEHNGKLAPTETASVACATCHERIREISPESQFGNISSFAVDHTPFRMAVIVGVGTDANGSVFPQIERVPFDPQNPPSEGSGLKFPHNKHLAEAGVKTPGGNTILRCADCHQQEPGGNLMRPIKFDRDCSGCHKMTFNAAGVERELPHASEDEVARIVRDYFVSAAMAGGVTTESAPEPVKRKRRRRIAGQSTTETKAATLTDDDREQAIQWATQEAQVQMDTIFGVRLCGNCHEARKSPGASGIDRWQVMPALLQRQWMPKARFDHEPHRVMDCTNCHNAPASTASSDVLMPGIATCQGCHKGQGEEDGARSECVDCHEYHVPGRSPMSAEHAEIFHARANARQKAAAN